MGTLVTNQEVHIIFLAEVVLKSLELSMITVHVICQALGADPFWQAFYICSSGNILWEFWAVE